MKIGDRVYVHGYVDEIRKDCVIIHNDGGYFGTVKSEIVEAQKAEDIVSVIRCKECKYRDKETANCTRFRKDWYVQSNSFCSWAEPKEEPDVSEM